MGNLVQFNASHVVFVAIDMQTKLSSAISEFEAAAAVLFKVKTLAACLDIPYLVTEHYQQGLGTTIACLASDNVIQKNTFSTPVEALIKLVNNTQRHVYVLGGVEAHVCVMQTALALLAAGQHVVVLADGMASRNPEHKQLAMAHLRQHGAWILPFESVVFQCLESCEHPKFKAVLELIK